MQEKFDKPIVRKEFRKQDSKYVNYKVLLQVYKKKATQKKNKQGHKETFHWKHK